MRIYTLPFRCDRVSASSLPPVQNRHPTQQLEFFHRSLKGYADMFRPCPLSQPSTYAQAVFDACTVHGMHFVFFSIHEQHVV